MARTNCKRSRDSLDLAIALFLVATSLTGCSTASTPEEAGPVEDFAGRDTYAWSSVPVEPLEVEGRRALDPGLEDRIVAVVDSELEALGFFLVSPRDASLIVTPHATVRRVARAQDPYYAQDAVVVLEEGTVSLDFADRRTRSLLWRGSSTGVLRTAARGSGLLRVRLAPTGEEPLWPVEDMVARILDVSGVRGDDPENPDRLRPDRQISSDARRALLRRIYDRFPE